MPPFPSAPRYLFWLCPLVLLLGVGEVAHAQPNRREQVRSPGLVIETGAPTSATRALHFTADGKVLLAAGEDKLVRSWPLDKNGTPDTARVTSLRWRTWHEWRGAIYTTALSPDAQQRYLAVAGYGAIVGEVVVIDRTTEKMIAGLTPPNEAGMGTVTWAVAFSPDGEELAIGKDDGSVWVWSFRKPGTVIRKLGSHGPREGKPVNRVHRLIYTGNDSLVSLAQDRKARLWNPRGGQPREVFTTNVPNLARSAVSADGQRVAVSGQDDPLANLVEVWSVKGGRPASLELPERALASALAFSPDGKQLAVAMERPTQEGKPHLPKQYQVWLCDLTADAVTKRDVIPAANAVDSLAFTQDAKQLAVAGGEDYSIRLFDVKKLESASQVRSPGRPIWSVGFSTDQNRIGFRFERNAAPKTYNDWGTGPWNVFDLKGRRWVDGREFRPVASVETLGGWSLRTDHHRDWFLTRGAIQHKLPWVYEEDSLPTCYTFVDAGGGAVQLAVGHKWGYSLFEVAEKGVRRIRVGLGHAGDVTAIAPSPNNKLLLTVSRDQTVCCWSTVPWENQRELGADFRVLNGQIVVGKVADGSPAWEAGLSPGDELKDLFMEGKKVENDWLSRLKDPPPNREVSFDIERPAVDGLLQPFTTVRQRPLWRFFPMQRDEWVLWRWRDYFYDCSANGDFAIGWQVNGEVGTTPAYYRAEQFRKNRHRPDKITEAVSVSLLAPERASIAELLPPRVELTVSASEVAGKDTVRAMVRIVASEDGLTRHPSSVSLWVNDHKIVSWPGESGFEKSVDIPAAALRVGQLNTIVAQAYDHRPDSSRGDSPLARVRRKDPATKPRLHGLFVGVADYSRTPATPGGGVWPKLLFPVKDAEELLEAWTGQIASGLYTKGRLLKLADDDVTRDRVLAELREFRKAVGPDDLVVVFLAGHGWAEESAKVKGQHDANAFAFVCPRFEVLKAERTGVTSSTLYDEVIALPARKLILLDTCHSGSVLGADYVRSLTPDGVGPAILCAAGRDEAALEDVAFGHGLFSRAVIDGLTDDAKLADRNGDGIVDPEELGEYVSRRVPQLLDKIRPRLPLADRSVRQTPQLFPLFRQPPN